MIMAILRGAWLGFCIAAPVGPIGVMVLTQTLQWGRRAGLASGLGAALADFTYGFLAIAGVRLAGGHARMVATTGGLVLLCLAWKSWRQPPAGNAFPLQRSRFGPTAATFLLTMSNPITILLFGGLIASAGTDAPAHFVVGIFLGSMIWWTILSLTAAWLRRWIAIRGVVLNRLAALTLACFGLWAIWSRGLH
jgi:threonine/homoserine/homoserine lactone efflux protein